MQKKIIKQSGRHRVSRFFHARDDKDTIAGWKSDLNRILVVFNVCPVYFLLVAANFPSPQTELTMNTHTIVADMHQNMLRTREATDSQNRVVGDNYFLYTAEKILIVAQTQNKSAISTTDRSSFLRLFLVYLENLHLHHRGPSLVVTS